MTKQFNRLARYQKKENQKKINLKKAVAYTRVSTDRQEDNTSLEFQDQAITHYCQAKDLEIVGAFSDVASGATLNRPELDKLRHLLLVLDSDVDAVIVYKLDRLSRSVVDGYSFIQKLKERDISIISINENIDNSTPTGQAMLQMIFTFAEMERKVITERMSSGRKAKSRKGIKAGGEIYGYHYNENKELSVVPEESRIIKLMYDLYEQKRSVRKVKAELDIQGLINRKGKSFSVQAIHYILTNATYLGYLIYSGEMVEGQHDPIISESQAHNVHRILKSKNKHSK